MNSYNGFSGAQRTAAQRWLNEQWKTGRLKRPCECCACGQETGVIHAHAEDYSEPFKRGKTDRYHLCFCCHMVVHCRFQNRGIWREYRRIITAGGRFGPIASWPAFMGSILRTPPARLEQRVTYRGLARGVIYLTDGA
ncbi:MAG: hypothetical protein GC190_21810 [Alphaproteobacteria bacterium]|nr:hypothetical protein [Alphaproteobacteria bacterium]